MPPPHRSLDRCVSFHQADIRFGETAGTQCLCNSLLSISWSLVRRVALWSSVHLDFILIKGDALYKSLNKRGYLTFYELPCQVDTDAGIFNIHKLHNEAGILQPRNKGNILKSLSKEDDRGHGILFIVASYSFAILWNKCNFFLFDPHSRTIEGKFCNDGTSVLLKFSSMRQLQIYIYEIYFPLRHSESEYLHYEMQCIVAEVNEGEKCNNVLNMIKETVIPGSFLFLLQHKEKQVFGDNWYLRVNSVCATWLRTFLITVL